MIRIVAGELRGRRLAVAPGVRPTTERAREALFSIVGDRVRGATSPRRRRGIGSARVRSPLARGARGRLRRSRPPNRGRTGGECRHGQARGAGPGRRPDGGELPPDRPPRGFRLRLLRPAVGRSGRQRARRTLDGSLRRRDVRRGAGERGEPVAGLTGRAGGSALRNHGPPHLPADRLRPDGPGKARPAFPRISRRTPADAPEDRFLRVRGRRSHGGTGVDYPACPVRTRQADGDFCSP